MQEALQLWVRDGVAGFAAPPALPLEALLRGRSVAEATALVPRLFNLCALAQGAALRLALGLPAPDAGELAKDILRDHMALLCLRWPQALGVQGPVLASGWATDRTRARRMLLGHGDLPVTGAEFGRWLASGDGVAPVLAAIATIFAPGEAAIDLPLVTAATAMQPGAVENSAAARQAGHPLLRAVAGQHGCGPLWQAAGRLVDALACLEERLPGAVLLADGMALAPASRGVCAVRARAQDGRIATFARCTPTDHLLASGGGLALALRGLRPATGPRLLLLATILDPCLPFTLREAAHA